MFISKVLFINRKVFQEVRMWGETDYQLILLENK
jgi:hypothetical protein